MPLLLPPRSSIRRQGSSSSHGSSHGSNSNSNSGSSRSRSKSLTQRNINTKPNNNNNTKDASDSDNDKPCYKSDTFKCMTITIVVINLVLPVVWLSAYFTKPALVAQQQQELLLTQDAIGHHIMSMAAKPSQDSKEKGKTEQTERIREETKEEQPTALRASAVSILSSAAANDETCVTRAPLSQIFSRGSTIGPPQHNCSYTWQSNNNNNQNPTAEQQELQQKLKDLLPKWKYDLAIDKIQQKWPGLLKRGARVLDVGMGQGPWGAAMLQYAIEHDNNNQNTNNNGFYVGLDPDVCPPIHARTRNHAAARRGSKLQCIKAYNFSIDEADELEASGKLDFCTGANDKYEDFALTGLEMMRAFPDRLALLPGTFETQSVQLKRMVLDVVLLKTVTEHLQHLQPVMRGLWDIVANGCSHSHKQQQQQTEERPTTILIDHHNYMDYSGHHGFPKKSREITADTPPQMLELADWNHVRDDASQSQNPTLNRVRPGDLQALLAVYFDCHCQRTTVNRQEKRRLTPQRKRHFEQLGFDVEMELYTSHLLFNCTAKQRPEGTEILNKLQLYHSPLDGSYRPQPLTNCPKADYLFL